MTGSISYAEQLIDNDQLDNPFTFGELRNVLKSVKSDKAPGPDRIPYEFFKNASDEFLNMLLTVYNNIFLVKQYQKHLKNRLFFLYTKKAMLI